jgi:hypothetical protein
MPTGIDSREISLAKLDWLAVDLESDDIFLVDFKEITMDDGSQFSLAFEDEKVCK